MDNTRERKKRELEAIRERNTRLQVITIREKKKSNEKKEEWEKTMRIVMERGDIKKETSTSRLVVSVIDSV